MFGTVCSGSHAGRMRAQEIGQNKAHMFAPRCAESAEIEKHAFLANLDNAGAHHVNCGRLPCLRALRPPVVEPTTPVEPTTHVTGLCVP